MHAFSNNTDTFGYGLTRHLLWTVFLCEATGSQWKQKLQRTLTTKSCTNFSFWCMTTIPLLGGLSSWPCITNTQGEKSQCSPAWNIKTFSLLTTRGNKLFKRSAFNLTFLLSLPLSFVNRTHLSHCVSIIYIHYWRLFRRDCLFYHLLLACGFNETFTLMPCSSDFMFFFYQKIVKNEATDSFSIVWEVQVLLGFQKRFLT